MPVWSLKVGVCRLCERDLWPRYPLCLRCGLPAAPHTRCCGRCQLKAPPWQALVTLSEYRNPLRKLLHQLKFNRRIALSHCLSRLILLSYLAYRREFGLAKPDLLLPVPLHRWRRWSRGFNQCERLAQPLSGWLNCAYSNRYLLRGKAASVQHRLSANARAKNLQGAFRLEKSVAGQHIALLDDVVTTGQTATEITQLLLQHGALTVQVWCLCRTL